MLKLLLISLLLISFPKKGSSSPHSDFFATGLLTLKVDFENDTYNLKLTYLLPCGVQEKGILLTPVKTRGFKVGVVLGGSAVQCAGSPSLITRNLRLSKPKNHSLSFIPHDPKRRKPVKLGFMQIFYNTIVAGDDLERTHSQSRFLARGLFYDDCSGPSGGYYINPRSGEIAPLFVSGPVTDNITSCSKKRHVVNLPPTLKDPITSVTLPYKTLSTGDGSRSSFHSSIELGHIVGATLKQSRDKDTLTLSVTYYRAPCRQLLLGAIINTPATPLPQLSSSKGINTTKVKIGVALISDNSHKNLICPMRQMRSTILIPKIGLAKNGHYKLVPINKRRKTLLHIESAQVVQNLKTGVTSVIPPKSTSCSARLGMIVTAEDPSSRKNYTGFVTLRGKSHEERNPLSTAKFSSRKGCKASNDGNSRIVFNTRGAKISRLYPLQITSYQ